MSAVLIALLVALGVWLSISPAPLRRLTPGPTWAGGLPRATVVMATAVGALVAAATGSAAVALLGGLVSLGVPPLVRRMRAGRPDRRMAAQLPDALDFLAVVLHSGAPLPAAVQAVAEISPQPTAELLHGVARSTHLGVDAAEAWSALAGHPVWGRAAADVARSARSGTMLAGTLRMHAEEARQEYRDRTIKAARTVGVRSVLPLMVCFLPAFVLVGVIPIIAGLLGGLLG
ncbi:MAG TPA: type II secretion system F family protein [Arachnia sp.]|nr:type II secretion system F family protein [Arachnia sp.]HMT86657.1 type II secretion system F family protein [Arachnia sp.]